MLNNLKLRFIPISIAIISSFLIGIIFTDPFQNVEFVKGLFEFLPEAYRSYALWGVNFTVVVGIMWISLKLMDLTVGERGLEHFQHLLMIWVGATILPFTILQFLDAVATSSAEGTTVIVEVIQQIVHFVQTGEMESYGLVGMLTSDASGPWNHSVFPMIILLLWVVRGKRVAISKSQLNIPMFTMALLYLQQWVFSFDLQYTLLEVLVMFVTSTFYVWGMFSILKSMFKASQQMMEEAKSRGKVSNKKTKAGIIKRIFSFIDGFFGRIAHEIFEFMILNWIPSWSKKLWKPKYGMGSERTGKIYGVMLLLIMTVAMFALVSAAQYLAVQFGAGKAEAALFLTAGLTSAPEVFVALKAGPVIGVLLFVGSNIIDGWFSSIGQLFLLGVTFAISGELHNIELAPVIRHLTFLSFSQGIITWGLLWLYADFYERQKDSVLVKLLTAFGLFLAVIYYFGGALMSAQFVGLEKQWPMAFPGFESFDWMITNIPNTNIEFWFTEILIILMFTSFIFRKKISKFITRNITGMNEVDRLVSNLRMRAEKKIGKEKIQIGFVFDWTTLMNNLIESEFVDLMLGQFAKVGLAMDKDGYFPVWFMKGDRITLAEELLQQDNLSTFITNEPSVGRKAINVPALFAPTIDKLAKYNDKWHEEEPVIIYIITRGGEDVDLVDANLEELRGRGIFIQFLAVEGIQELTGIDDLEELANRNKDLVGFEKIKISQITHIDKLAKLMIEKVGEVFPPEADHPLAEGSR